MAGQGLAGSKKVVRWGYLLLWGVAGGLLAAGCARIRPVPNNTGAPQVLWSIQFRFVDKKESELGSSTLLKAMESAPTSLGVKLTRFRTLFGDYNMVNPAVVEADMRRLRQLYRHHGFYQARVLRYDVKVITKKAPYRPYQRVKLVFWIREGKKVRLRRVQFLWKSTIPAKERKAILKGLALKKGGTFSTPDYRILKGQLQKRLQDKTYALSQIKGRVFVDKKASLADLLLEIRPGPPCKFGAIQIVNNQKIPKKLIRKFFTFEQGDKYRVQALVDTQNKLFSLGVFTTVNFKPDLEAARKATSIPRQIPIRLEVREDKFQLWKLGAGFVADGQRHQLEGSVGWTYHHFLGGLRKLELQFRPGYAFLPDILTRYEHGPDITASLAFTQPFFMDRQAELSLRLLYRRSEEFGGNDYQKLSPSVSFSRPIFWKISGMVSYNIELAFDVQNPVELTRESYQLSYFEEQIVLDLRNDPIQTRSGIFLALTLQQAGIFGEGTFRYFKVTPEFRFYLPLFWGIVLAGRLQYGYLWSRRLGEVASKEPSGNNQDDLVRFLTKRSPITQRFFSGGANSVRGWTARFLGPLACQRRSKEWQAQYKREGDQVRAARQNVEEVERVPKAAPPTGGTRCRSEAGAVARQRFGDLANRMRGLPQGWDRGEIPLAAQHTIQVVPIGGEHLFEGSLELRIPLKFIWSGLGIVAFFDTGAVQLTPDWATLGEAFTFTVGGGLRLKTPIGAIRVDVGFRLFPDERRYPLQPSWALHLSIGEAF